MSSLYVYRAVIASSESIKVITFDAWSGARIDITIFDGVNAEAFDLEFYDKIELIGRFWGYQLDLIMTLLDRHRKL